MKQQFVASKTTKHFKMDKTTKRMMALMSFPKPIHLSVAEAAEYEKETKMKLTPLTKKDFKDLMIRGQLSEVDSKITGMNDPLWKPKRKEEEVAVEGAPGNASPASKTRKGKKACFYYRKKAPKMRPVVEAQK